MTGRHEQLGGVRSQLRSLASRASIEGEWDQLHPQAVRVQRETSIPGIPDSQLGVGFNAFKYVLKEPGSRTPRLLTRYSLMASLVYDSVPAEYTPEYVQYAFRQQRLSDWDTARHGIEIISDPSNGDERTALELLHDDCMMIEDELLRFERRVELLFDGRGQPLQESRANGYVTAEEGRTIVMSSGTISLTGNDYGLTRQWADEGPDTADFVDDELLQHTDLQLLEFMVERKNISRDFEFLEMAFRADKDLRLRKASADERRQQSLALLAFLRFEGNVSDVTTLLYD